MRAAVAAIGTSQKDAASRLRNIKLEDSDAITITVTDPKLPNGTGILGYTINSNTDDVYTILTSLANQFVALDSSYKAKVNNKNLTLNGSKTTTYTFSIIDGASGC